MDIKKKLSKLLDCYITESEYSDLVSEMSFLDLLSLTETVDNNNKEEAYKRCKNHISALNEQENGRPHATLNKYDTKTEYGSDVSKTNPYAQAYGNGDDETDDTEDSAADKAQQQYQDRHFAGAEEEPEVEPEAEEDIEETTTAGGIATAPAKVGTMPAKSRSTQQISHMKDSKSKSQKKKTDTKRVQKNRSKKKGKK